MALKAGLRTLIDLRGGAFGALVMGLVVWGINMATTIPPDLFGSITAGFKQGVYAFFSSGLILSLTTWLVVRPGKHTKLIPLTSVLYQGRS